MAVLYILTYDDLFVTVILNILTYDD